MNAKFLSSKEKKQYIEKLNSQFGISELPWLLIETGKDKVRAFSGDLTRGDINKIARIANVELIGMYLFKEELGGIRFGFDGSMMLKDKISKNILGADEEQVKEWLLGKDLNIKLAKGVYVVTHAGDTLGCGMSDGEKLINFVPKERRIRSK